MQSKRTLRTLRVREPRRLVTSSITSRDSMTSCS